MKKSKQKTKKWRILKESIQNEEIKNKDIQWRNSKWGNKNKEDEINTNSKIFKLIIQNEKIIKLKMNLDNNSLFLIIDIYSSYFQM